MTPDLKNVRYLITEVDPHRLAPSRAEVAFVGRSNVGKSSLINALCYGRVLARVSKTPGRTRTINVYETGEWAWLVDLPGYGFAVGSDESRQSWSAMIEGYLTTRPRLRTVFVLVDAKVGATPLDQSMAQWLVAHGVPFRVLANKADQVKMSRQVAQRHEISAALRVAPEAIAWISAKEGTGLDALRKDVLALLTVS